MKALRLYMLEIVSGLMSGMLGGLAAGFLFGLMLVIISYIGSGEQPDSLFEVAFPFLFPSTVVGLVAGCLLGVLVGITIPITRPYLGRISPVLGGIITMIPSLFFLNSGWPIYISGMIIFFALVAGMLGGNLAFRFYTKIYE